MTTQAFTPEATQARIQHEGLRSKIMTAEQAAELIQPGFNVGMSGFTGYYEIGRASCRERV